MPLEPVGDYLMVSCSVAPGTVIPPAGEWTGETPAMLRDAMLPTLGMGANLALRDARQLLEQLTRA